MAVADPVYPVYVDSNVMAGRTGPQGADGRYPGLVYLPCTFLLMALDKVARL